MVRLIQKSGYIKASSASGYMKYIATRERVEKLEGSGSVTKGQRQLIENLLRDFPDAAELEEYSDYRQRLLVDLCGAGRQRPQTHR